MVNSILHPEITLLLGKLNLHERWEEHSLYHLQDSLLGPRTSINMNKSGKKASKGTIELDYVPEAESPSIRDYT